MAKESPVNEGRISVWPLRGNVRQVIDLQERQSRGVHLRLRSATSVSSAVGPDENGMSARSKSLLELRPGRRQGGRHELRERQDLDVFAPRCHE